MAQNLSTVLRIIARDETKGALTKTRQELVGLSNTLDRIKNQALALAGINFGLGGLAQLAATADTYQLLTARLQLLSGETENFLELQEKVFQVAQDTFSSYDQIVQIYGNLAASTQEVGLESEQLLTITQALSEAYIISGATQQEAKASTIQLVQALASGQLRGQEFNSVAEQGRRILFALKDATGLSAGELRAFAGEGKLTTEFFVNAFLPQAEKINEEFQQLPLTIARSLTQLQNAFQKTIGELNQEAGVTLTIAEAIQALAFNFEDAADTIITASGLIITVLTGRFVQAQALAARSRLNTAAATNTALQAEARYAAAKERAAARAVQVAIAEENAARRLTVIARQQNINLETRILLNNRLQAAVIARAAAETAATAATTAATAATVNASIAVRSYRAVLGLLGGPLGALTVAIIGVGFALNELDKAFESGEEALENFLETVEKTEETADKIAAASGKISTSLDDILTDETRARFAREIQTLAKGELALRTINNEIQELESRPIGVGRSENARRNRLRELTQAYEEAKEKVDEYAVSVREQVIAENELRSIQTSEEGVGLPVRLRDSLAAQEDANTRLQDIEKDRRKLVEQLDQLSQELSGPTIDFEAQTSALNITALNRLRDEIQGDIERGDAESAIQNIEKARQVIETLRKQDGTTSSFLKTQLDLVRDLAERVGDIDTTIEPEVTFDREAIQEEARNLVEGIEGLFDIDLGIDVDENAAQAEALRGRNAAQATLDQAPLFLRWGNTVPGGTEAQANAMGGRIIGPGGPTSDNILSWLSNGEYVVRAAAAKYYGYDVLERLNAMRLPRYAQGGAVRAANVPSGGAQGAPIIFNVAGQQIEATVSGPQVSDLRDVLRRENMKRGSRA